MFEQGFQSLDLNHGFHASLRALEHAVPLQDVREKYQT